MGRNRDTNATCSCTPAASHAASIATASSRVVATGFSHSTCRPRAAACSTWARCSTFALQTTTASTSGSPSRASTCRATGSPKSCSIQRVCSGIGVVDADDPRVRRLGQGPRVRPGVRQVGRAEEGHADRPVEGRDHDASQWSGRRCDRSAPTRRAARAVRRASIASAAGTGEGPPARIASKNVPQLEGEPAVGQHVPPLGRSVARVQDRRPSGRRCSRSAGPRCRRSRAASLNPRDGRVRPAALDVRDGAVRVPDGGQGRTSPDRRRCRPPCSAPARPGCRSPSARSRSCARPGRGAARRTGPWSASQPASLQPGRSEVALCVSCRTSSDRPGLDEVAGGPVVRLVARHVADHQQPGRVLGRGDHAPGLLERAGQRLLADHVPARRSARRPPGPRGGAAACRRRPRRRRARAARRGRAPPRAVLPRRCARPCPAPGRPRRAAAPRATRGRRARARRRSGRRPAGPTVSSRRHRARPGIVGASGWRSGPKNVKTTRSSRPVFTTSWSRVAASWATTSSSSPGSPPRTSSPA